MNEEFAENIGTVLFGEMGKRTALEAAVEAMLMVMAVTKPELIEPMKDIFQKLAEEKWDDLDEHSKASFQDYAGRVLGVLEMTKGR